MKAFLLTFLGLALGLGTYQPSHAQVHHSQADIYLEQATYSPGMKVGLFIELEKDWHTYWINPGQTGSPPVINIKAEGASTSEVFAPAPMRISTPTAESFAFENEVLFYKTLTLDTPPSEPITLTIEAEWLVCKDICIPCTQSFEVTLLPSGKAKKENLFSQFVFPTASHNVEAWINPYNATLYVQGLSQAASIDAFPINPNAFSYLKPQSRSMETNPPSVVFEQIQDTPERFQVVTYDNKGHALNAYWVTPLIENRGTQVGTTQSTSHSDPNLLMILLLALVGGLLLNLMPCVFPVIAIKFFKLTQIDQAQKRKLIISNLTYSFGVISSFLVLAFGLVFLRSLGQELGWGFQLQSPLSVGLMIFLFYLIGMNFLGLFEVSSVPLPGFAQKAMNQHSFWGDFFTGVFTTAVATPCTAPFMAASIGYALTQNAFVIFMTFLMLGVGLSSPYLLLSVFPSLSRYLPKPGAWMETFKEWMALPMFITAAWLIWVYSKLGTDQALLFLLISLVFLEFAVRALKYSKKGYLTIALLLISVAVAAYPFSKPDETETSISWIDFSPATLDALVGGEEYVFVDFTADWCLTCKANEALTFTHQEVLRAIQEHNIQMIKADWTRKDPEITRKLREFDRIGVPFYLLYAPRNKNPKILPTVLTPSAFLEAIDSHP